MKNALQLLILIHLRCVCVCVSKIISASFLRFRENSLKSGLPPEREREREESILYHTHRFCELHQSCQRTDSSPRLRFRTKLHFWLWKKKSEWRTKLWYSLWLCKRKKEHIRPFFAHTTRTVQRRIAPFSTKSWIVYVRLKYFALTTSIFFSSNKNKICCIRLKALLCGFLYAASQTHVGDACPFLRESHFPFALNKMTKLVFLTPPQNPPALWRNTPDAFFHAAQLVGNNLRSVRLFVWQCECCRKLSV